MEKNLKIEDPQIEVRIKKIPEDMFKEIDSMLNGLKRVGIIKVAKRSVKRVCDDCGNTIEKGDKFKGSGVQEFCSNCSEKKKIKGDYKINDY